MYYAAQDIISLSMLLVFYKHKTNHYEDEKIDRIYVSFLPCLCEKLPDKSVEFLY